MNALAKNAYVAYRKNDVQNLRPVEIVSRLYSTLLSRLHSVQDSIADGRVADKANAMSSSFAILSELHASLDLDQGGEIAANLNDLYGHLFSELTLVNLHNDTERLAGAIKTIEPLSEAWAELADTGAVNRTPVAGQGQSLEQEGGKSESPELSPLPRETNISLNAVL
ncbi:MAG: flagellar export chaperone FliS [Desulfobulbaceae bacterium]|nr:flagellar export chaperone FliS [Desulfobulbaceae bacterium]